MYWLTAGASLTAVNSGWGKYGTAGGFQAALAHTANVRRPCLTIVSSLHTHPSVCF